jgi:putative DNA primase/helicase
LLTGNGIVGFDLDDCKDLFGPRPEVQQWVANALYAGAYCEWSPSGKGLRLFMRGTLPGTGRKQGNLEIYDQGRFLTITGHVVGKEDLPWAS